MNDWRKRMSAAPVSNEDKQQGIDPLLEGKDLKELSAMYNQQCAFAGDIQYRILCMSEELTLLNNKLRIINQRAAVLKQEEAAKVLAEPEAPVAVEEVKIEEAKVEEVKQEGEVK